MNKTAIEQCEQYTNGQKYIEYSLNKDCILDRFYLNIMSISQATIDFPESTKQIHRNKFYTILWFFSGEGYLIVNSHKYHIQPGRLFFINPQQTHSYQKKDNLSGIMIFFSTTFFNLLATRLADHIKYGIFFKKGDCVYCDTNNLADDILRRTLQNIKSEFNEPFTPVHWYIMASWFSQFILYAERLCSWNQSVSLKIDCRAYQVYIDFLALVEEDFQRKKDVKWYAQKLGVSTVLLSRYVKLYNENRDMTPLKIINNRIMLEAQSLLKHFNYNIDEIAERVGFSNSSNFTKFFKAQDKLNRTPSAYRLLWAESTPTDSKDFK